MLKTVTAAACLCATMAQAQSSTLSGQQIHDLVVGTRVEIDTPIGTKLPIRYGRDGRLSGEARGLASYLGTAFDNGRWWVASDQLCHKWNRWFNSEPQCMRLSREGRTIHWRTRDGYAGTAVISVPAALQAGTVLHPPQPVRAKPIAPPEMPSAPAAGSDAQPASPAKDAGQPPQPAAKEAEVQAAPDITPPVPVPATRSANAPRQPQVQAKRARQPVFRVVNVPSDDVLNVRSGPSADFDVVGGLPPGSRGIAITSACRSAWCPVQHRSTSGWVNRAYLAPEEPSPPLSRYGSFNGG
jgi:hypothetical protein